MQSSTRKNWVPALAVAAVAVTAVLAAFMSPHPLALGEDILAAAPEAAETAAAPGVVMAPPLVTSRQVRAAPGEELPAARAMGADTACANCGVVETVVAVEGHARGQRQTVGYLMQIRMDDGTLRLVEHRGAMAAGSRVLVERGVVRTVPLQS